VVGTCKAKTDRGTQPWARHDARLRLGQPLMPLERIGRPRLSIASDLSRVLTDGKIGSSRRNSAKGFLRKTSVYDPATGNGRRVPKWSATVKWTGFAKPARLAVGRGTLLTVPRHRLPTRRRREVQWQVGRSFCCSLACSCGFYPWGDRTDRSQAGPAE